MRTTDDKKDKSVRVRLNEETYRQLKIESEKAGIGMSEIIRNLVVDFVHHKVK